MTCAACGRSPVVRRTTFECDGAERFICKVCWNLGENDEHWDSLIKNAIRLRDRQPSREKCPDCLAPIGRGSGLCEGTYANQTDKTLCCLRQIERLTSQLAASRKALEAADALRRESPPQTEPDPLLLAYDTAISEARKVGV